MYSTENDVIAHTRYICTATRRDDLEMWGCGGKVCGEQENEGGHWTADEVENEASVQ